MRTLVAVTAEMTGMVGGGSGGKKADIDNDPGGAKPRVALPGHFRIGILDRRHHARNAGGNDGVGTGGRAAEMRTRLERDIERGAAGGFASATQRLRLRMRPAARLGPATADNHAVLDHDGADGRIGPGAA